MALAGTSINFPKSNIYGKGEAYQSWNKDQDIAIQAINLRFQDLRLFYNPASLSNFSTEFESSLPLLLTIYLE